LIITAVNVFGGIVIGVTHYDLPIGQAADVYTKLSVGDGLVSQIPALIVSLSAGLLVSKGGTRGSAEEAVLTQLGNYPRAISVASMMMLVLAVLPGLPFLPFAALGAIMAFIGYSIPRRRMGREKAAAAQAAIEKEQEKKQADSKDAVKESLKTAEIELCLGRQLSIHLLSAHGELVHRVGKMRRKFAKQYGFIVPDIKLTDNLNGDPKEYQIKLHGTIVAHYNIRIGDLLL